MHVMAEELQEHGRKGALNVKRWLEATMRFELTFDVYTATVQTTVDLASGGEKRFDLMGTHYDEIRGNPRQIYVEVKSATREGNLSSQWRDFVATAYSATHYRWARGRDPELEFMFASTHAWSSSLYWTLTELPSILEACAARPDLMPESGVNEEWARVLASRLFLWVVPRRQDDMTMGSRFRGVVMQKIGEGGQ